jgi:hypothetical protein
MNMEEQTSRSLARRASAYGLATLPAKDQHEYTDPHNEAVVEHRWRSVCERHGAAVLGVREVPTRTLRLDIDGITWELGPVGSAERQVPQEVFHRWRALEAEGVPFLWWLWGEEQPQRPQFRPLPQATSRPDSWQVPAAPQRDPIVIGVIPTAPGRGVWVLIGRWFH